MKTQIPLDTDSKPILGYALVIHEATSIINRDDLEEIEDTMRHVIYHSTLDWQSRDMLKQGARDAWEVVQIMRDPVRLAAALAA